MPASPSGLELIPLLVVTLSLRPSGSPHLGRVDRCHASRAKLLMLAFLPLLATNAVSVAAVHVATTAGVEEGPDVKPMRSRPPDVQLLRTLC